MKFYKTAFILPVLIYSHFSAFSQTASSRQMVCMATKTLQEPLCIIVFKKKSYTIGRHLADSLIDPQRVESMTIEKEPKASAIYGSRAANGVVIIVIKDAIARKEYKKLKPYLSGL